jgi:hypothetical protein
MNRGRVCERGGMAPLSTMHNLVSHICDGMVMQHAVAMYHAVASNWRAGTPQNQGLDSLFGSMPPVFELWPFMLSELANSTERDTILQQHNMA